MKKKELKQLPNRTTTRSAAQPRSKQQNRFCDDKKKQTCESLRHLGQKPVNLRDLVIQEYDILEKDLEGLMLGLRKRFSKDGLKLLHSCRVDGLC